MQIVTYPNQKMVHIHRIQAKSDFLGILNDNWQFALRDLQPYAFALYLYFAANADNYRLALSPEAVHNSIGMARSTYRDQLKKLIAKGYLVEKGANSYDFYEMPQTRAVQSQTNDVAAHSFEDTTNAQRKTATDKFVEPANIEINNTQFSKNNLINKEKKQKPTVAEKEAFIF